MATCCCILLPIVDQSRIFGIAVETTGPLPNTDFCQCNCGPCKKKHRRSRRHR